MRILLITIAYPPEIRSISTMTKELADELANRGHTVTVITSWPRYNLSQDAKGKNFQEDMQEGKVRVIRINTLPHHKVWYPLRGIAQITLPFLFVRALNRLIKEKINVVAVYSPHLPLTRIGAYVKKKHQARYLLNIQDIFPQNAIDLGILKNKLLIRFFERMEKNAYQDADALTTCTEGAKKFLIEKKQVPADKITVVYNWIDAEMYKNISSRNIYRREYAIEGKFVILFAGILGPAQGLNYVIEVARRVKDIKEVIFLFVGDGTEKHSLETMVSAYGLPNVLFKPFISPDDYPFLLKEVNAGLLCLQTHSHTPTIPGKFFGFAAASLPIIAFLNSESDGHHIISDARCGFSLVPDDPERGAALIRQIIADRSQLDRMGARGYDYVAQFFSKKTCINSLERLIINT